MRLAYTVMKGLVFLGMIPLAAGVGIAIGLASYAHGYSNGLKMGYAQGSTSGQDEACSRVVDWARWAASVEKDMVKSNHYPQSTGNEVVQVINGGYGYVCMVDVPPTIYEPGPNSPGVALNTIPTLPVAANRKPLKKI